MAAARSSDEPHDRDLLARAVTLYHFIVEGDLAQPGQHIIET